MTNYLELLYLISFTGILAVAYSYLLSGQIISSSPGNSRMQEIAEAIQIGAKAYLNRQYKTIAVVGVIVLAIVSYFFNYPSLFLLSGDDKVVENQKAELFYTGMDKKLAQKVNYPKMRHDLLNETCRSEVFSEIIKYIEKTGLR